MLYNNSTLSIQGDLDEDLKFHGDREQKEEK